MLTGAKQIRRNPWAKPLPFSKLKMSVPTSTNSSFYGEAVKMRSYELHDLHNNMYETKRLPSLTSVVNLSKTLMSWHETWGWWWISFQLQDMQKAFKSLKLTNLLVHMILWKASINSGMFTQMYAWTQTRIDKFVHAAWSISLSTYMPVCVMLCACVCVHVCVQVHLRMYPPKCVFGREIVCVHVLVS